MFLEDHEARKRNTFLFQSGIDTLSAFFLSRKEGAQVFEIPFHLKEAGEPICPWPNVIK